VKGKKIRTMNSTFSQGFGIDAALSGAFRRKRVKEQNKERGWNSYVKPISTFNENVHKSQRIDFERI